MFIYLGGITCILLNIVLAKRFLFLQEILNILMNNFLFKNFFLKNHAQWRKINL